MTPETIIDVFKEALKILFVLHMIILVPILVVGLVVSMFQAATQINEMTLSFLPKLAVTGLILILAGPWMIRYLLDYTTRLVTSIPFLIG